MPDDHSGRLELTWTDKDKTLLAHEDGRYEWVDPADYRVAEVRLFHDVAQVGDTGPPARLAADNLLIRGDALHALHTLNRTPEFAREYVGKVRLCYIDPPFNTGQAFAQYDDSLEHSVWLTMLRDRVVQLSSLLSSDGSVWVHLDDTEVHRARCVLDETFGSANFVASVAWEKTYTPKSNGRGLSTDHDHVLVYAKSADEWLSHGWNLLPRSEAQSGRFSNPDGDSRGPWRTYPLDVRTEHEGRREVYRYPVVLPSGRTVRPAQGRHWALPQAAFEEQVRAGAIWFGASGDAMPTKKVFLAEARPGVLARTWWPHTETGHSQEAKREIKALFPEVEPFATPKPERLMQRIIHIATNPGDVVLDFFGGSGTTAAVAHKMGRRWVTVEQSPETVATFALPRLQRVVAGEDPGGVTTVVVPTGEQLPDGVKGGEAKAAARVLDTMAKAGAFEDLDELSADGLSALIKELRAADKTTTETVWSGGGGFRVLDVGPSMFTVVDGRVYLADWATNGALAEAIAAQYGYTYEADPPFAGRKGRTRLAVVDGLVNEGVARLLVDALALDEKVAICGTAVDPDARAILRELRPGSTIRKVPAALLDEYRQSRKEWLRLAGAIDWSDASALLSTDADDANRANSSVVS